MQTIAADLHIHSPHSIGVSKHMTIPNLSGGALKKGVSLIGTGDATQPDWLAHLEKTLSRADDMLSYNGVAFIPTVEVEDADSIHHVIILPHLDAVRQLRTLLSNNSPNLDHEWGGRPRVNLKAEPIAGMVRDVGGMIGPAHAFTPFRSIFREGKYDSLKACYGDESEHIHFLELGLSADTEIADYIPSLRRLTYITSSDAHSPSPDKLGREFIRLEIKAPTFEEVKKAFTRTGGRKVSLNVGLHPKLGKYYLSFCSKCRRTLVVMDGKGSVSFDDMNIYIECENETDRARLLSDIHKRAVRCPHDGKPLRLGVRDRAMMLGEVKSLSPSHRPQYMHIPPLLEMIQLALGTSSPKAKSVTKLYDRMIETLGTEVDIITSSGSDEVDAFNTKVGVIIGAYRSGKIKYIPGGGGRYGSIVAPWDV